MKITHVDAVIPDLWKNGAKKKKKKKKKFDMTGESGEVEDGSWLSETRIANPMSMYPRYAARRSSWTPSMPQAAIRIRTDEGITGYGFSLGGEAAICLIENHLEDILVGKDPFAVEKLWDQMFKVTLPYGRKGLPVMVISGIDIALWDIICKAKEEPLYRMLGGKVRDKLPAYITGNDIEWYQDMGFHGHKLAVPYGPAGGLEGMKKNERLVAQTREAVGDDVYIMLDCYMAWDVEYTVRMAEILEPYNVRWIEEALPPDDYEGYSDINRLINSTSIATGEHEYTRWGFLTLLDKKGAGILQPDVQWVGGITEVRKIYAMASARNLPVIPHAGGLQPWAVHVMFSQVNCPLAEYLITYDRGDEPEERVWESRHQVKDGYIYASEEPGVGIKINKDIFTD